MSEIFFYHLMQSKLEDTLPGLVMRSLRRGWRVLIVCGTEDACQKLDKLLWVFSDAEFIPHGLATEPYPQEQPVLLNLSSENLNKADVCFCVEGAVAPNPQDYQRLCMMFDGGNETQLTSARKSWKNWKAEQGQGESAHIVTYWKQTLQKKWEQKG